MFFVPLVNLSEFSGSIEIKREVYVELYVTVGYDTGSALTFVYVGSNFLYVALLSYRMENIKKIFLFIIKT